MSYKKLSKIKNLVEETFDLFQFFQICYCYIYKDVFDVRLKFTKNGTAYESPNLRKNGVRPPIFGENSFHICD